MNYYFAFGRSLAYCQTSMLPLLSSSFTHTKRLLMKAFQTRSNKKVKIQIKT